MLKIYVIGPHNEAIGAFDITCESDADAIDIGVAIAKLIDTVLKK